MSDDVYDGPMPTNGYGVWVTGSRPTSKKQVRTLLASNPSLVRFESTSLHHPQHDFRGDQLTERAKKNSRPFQFQFVGPDPEKNRKFFGTVKVTVGGLKVE